MARSFITIISLTGLLSTSLVCSAPAPIGTPEPALAPPPPVDKRCPQKYSDWGDKDLNHRPPFEEGQLGKFKKKLEQMNAEDRQHFQENWKRWRQMNDKEHKDWQQRALQERDRLKKNIDDALIKLGLNLNRDQREIFELRYHQERRKIEQQLCKEMDEKRKTEIESMLQRLKAEFSVGKPAAATP